MTGTVCGSTGSVRHDPGRDVARGEVPEKASARPREGAERSGRWLKRAAQLDGSKTEKPGQGRVIQGGGEIPAARGSSAPRPDGAAIHMREVRARVATDATGVTRQGGLDDLVDRTGLQPKVGGLALHVQGMFGNTA